MAKTTAKAAALALYMSATDCEGYTAAAHALAALLDTKPKAPTMADLDAPVSSPRKRGAASVGVLCSWADGSSTYQRIAFAKPAEKWAAAFQACDRLRRLRAASRGAAWCAVAGIETTIAGPVGVRHQSPDWLEVAKAAPMAPLESIMCEDTGETFTPSASYGAGDPERHAAAVERITTASAERHAAGAGFWKVAA